ncbi:MAG: peptidylprolyl isomerase [Anaerolineae bacterium]|nr:peptidylprolyl isomerase [Anaerolineae bacterium]
MAVDKITDGVVVSLAYVLTVDGEEVGRADANEPLEYLHGAENIVPGLEAALEGKTVGDKLNITLPPEEAYGDYDDDEIDEFDLEDIPGGANLEEGMIVEVEDDDGFVYVGTVMEITEDSIMVDFNPPLAGKTLTFDVEVLSLRPAEQEELDHGHPHSLDEFYDDEDHDHE